MATEPTAVTLRINADIPRDLHQRFKIACLKRAETMTDVLTNFVMKYVELTEKGKNK